MKAIGITGVFLLAVFLVFAVIGAPSFSTDSSGTSVSFGAYSRTGAPATGANLFDYWSMAEKETTERVRIEQLQATQRLIVQEEEATQRNADFWQTFPLTILAVALCILAAAAGILAWRWEPDRVPRQITINHYAPLPLQRYAQELGIPDAEYEREDGEWVIIEPLSRLRVSPPAHIALLPERRA